MWSTREIHPKPGDTNPDNLSDSASVTLMSTPEGISNVLFSMTLIFEGKPPNERINSQIADVRPRIQPVIDIRYCYLGDLRHD